MSGSVGGDTAEPNLTPILDMVFQLITFFMLVTNFKAQALDQSLNLPVVGSAKLVKDDDTQENLLILNIDKEGKLKYFNQVKPDVEKFIAKEAAGIRVALGLGKDDEIPVMVVVRADQATPFSEVYKVIKSCQDHGYRKFSLKALDRPPSN